MVQMSDLGFTDAPDLEESGVCPFSTEEVAQVFLNFLEMGCGNLYKYQKRIAYAMLVAVISNRGDVLSVLCARQSGKSQVVAAVIFTLMILLPFFSQMFPKDDRFNLYDEVSGISLGYSKGFNIGMFGPKKETADIIYNRVRSFFKGGQGKLLLDTFGLTFTVSNGKMCSLSNGSFIEANTANEGASIEGKSYHLLITDETQDIADGMLLKSILPMGASTNATVVHIGTASIGKCYFYYTQKQNQRNFINGGVKCHFEVDYREAASENKFYAKYIETQKTKLGERSDSFRMSYNNEWILERGQFMTKTMLKSFGSERPIGDFHCASHLPRIGKLSIACGIDFAKVRDRTVLTAGVVDFDNPVFEREICDDEEWRLIRYFGVDIVEWLSFEGDDYESQYIEISNYLQNLPFPLARLCVDATGCGDPIFDRFKADYGETGTDVMGIKFTPKSKDDMYRHLLRAVRQNHITYPTISNDTDQDRDYHNFISEFEDLEKTYSNGLMLVRHPDEPGAHDDYPDSTALLVQACSSSPETGEIEVEDNNFFMSRR